MLLLLLQCYWRGVNTRSGRINRTLAIVRRNSGTCSGWCICVYVCVCLIVCMYIPYVCMYVCMYVCFLVVQDNALTLSSHHPITIILSNPPTCCHPTTTPRCVAINVPHIWCKKTSRPIAVDLLAHTGRMIIVYRLAPIL